MFLPSKANEFKASFVVFIVSVKASIKMYHMTIKCGTIFLNEVILPVSTEDHWEYINYRHISNVNTPLTG